MADSLWPLVGVCPSWKGNLIESAFQDLLRGMERERSRLKGSSHLVMIFRREYDLDGLTEYLEILRGFVAEDSAIQYADSWIENSLDATKKTLEQETHEWHIDPVSTDARFKAGIDSERVHGRHLRSFKARKKSGFVSLYMQLEVIHIQDPNVIGPDLFAYFDAEWEWQSFLIDRGRLGPTFHAHQSRK